MKERARDTAMDNDVNSNHCASAAFEEFRE